MGTEAMVPYPSHLKFTRAKPVTTLPRHIWWQPTLFGVPSALNYVVLFYDGYSPTLPCQMQWHTRTLPRSAWKCCESRTRYYGNSRRRSFPWTTNCDHAEKGAKSRTSFSAKKGMEPPFDRQELRRRHLGEDGGVGRTGSTFSHCTINFYPFKSISLHFISKYHPNSKRFRLLPIPFYVVALRHQSV